MLTNPTLRTLGLEDWSQRYRNSLIDYDGQLRYCYGFFPVTGGLGMEVGLPIQNKTTITLDPDKVNAARIKPGWAMVEHKGKKYLMSCSYSDHRQYSRGYNRTNTYYSFLYNPDGFDREFEWLYRVLTTVKSSPTKQQINLTTPQVIEAVKKNNGLLINRLMVIGPRDYDPDTLHLVYRRKNIGIFDKDHLNLFSPVFEQEVKEALPQVKYLITGKTEAKPPARQKKMFLSENDFEAAIARPAPRAAAQTRRGTSFLVDNQIVVVNPPARDELHTRTLEGVGVINWDIFTQRWYEQADYQRILVDRAAAAALRQAPDTIRWEAALDRAFGPDVTTEIQFNDENS
jgi:hypothetical protein